MLRSSTPTTKITRTRAAAAKQTITADDGHTLRPLHVKPHRRTGTTATWSTSQPSTNSTTDSQHLQRSLHDHDDGHHRHQRRSPPTSTWAIGLRASHASIGENNRQYAVSFTTGGHNADWL